MEEEQAVTKRLSYTEFTEQAEKLGNRNTDPIEAYTGYLASLHTEMLEQTGMTPEELHSKNTASTEMAA